MDLLAAQGILKRILQHHGSKASIFQCSVQFYRPTLTSDFPDVSDSKTSVHNVEDQGSVPGSGRSPGEGIGNPLQYSCLENSIDRETC